MGDYIVGDALGEGGFSFVKVGIHKTTKERVALKMLKKDKLNLNSSVKKQVEREIVAMEKIHHKNVIRLKMVDWDAKYEKKNGQLIEVILVVLELANGGELFEFLSFTGCFEEPIARTYFHQLIDGAAYCHSNGVCHRDLKPENLLLDDNFVLKLADFGFSSVFGSSNRTMYTECGTPGYMAPEMFLAKGYDPVMADIWACGVILFIMLAGFPPFQKPNMTDWWFNKLQTGKHSLFWQAHSRSAHFSENTKDLINKILNPDPQRRISIQDIRRHPWFEGSTISESALLTELSRRKNQVDEQKARTRLEKKQQQSKAHQEDGHLSPIVVRDLDEMPPNPPSFEYNAPDQPNKQAPQQSVQQSFSFDFDPFAAPSPFVEVRKPKLEVYNANSQVACYTQFETKEDPTRVMSRLNLFFQDIKAQYDVDETAFFIKATIVTASHNVVLTVKIFADATDETKSVVQFRRRKGDSMQYRSIYFAIREHLGDLVLSKNPQSADSSPDASAVPAFAIQAASFGPN